jgi:hypothetical protein
VLDASGALRSVFRPVVTVCTAGHELRWRGRFLAEWIGSGEHVFTIEPVGEGRVQFDHQETFGGLVPLVSGWLVASTVHRGFVAMNSALKSRAEDG